MREQVDPSRGVRWEPGGRPAIAGPIVSSVRSMMTDSGAWSEIKAAFVRRFPQDAGWLEEPTWSVWVDLDRHVGLLDAAAEVIGLDGVKDIGRRRLGEELKTGLFASIVRSWLRSFAQHPSHLLRVVPYLWRAGFRDCGDMVLVDTQDRMLCFRLENPPSHLRDSASWRALLVGFGEGMLELSAARGEVDIHNLDEDPETVELVGRWEPRS